MAPTLVTIDGPTATRRAPPIRGWCAGATETWGNNVDAYTDINSPNGFSANDFRATVTAPGAFDRVYDTQQGPLISTEQQMAAIAQLFYSINWLHRRLVRRRLHRGRRQRPARQLRPRGGVAGDVLLAEAQDSANQGRRNNANMSTPSDGMSPAQVYLWSGQLQQSVTLSSVAGEQPATTSSAYGPAPTT
ncbi:MAG: hypothetical protein HS111_23240 [Kofleriaceae bacterium]|nr:hypothetical protein [Kofleriaceae bacterium]